MKIRLIYIFLFLWLFSPFNFLFSQTEIDEEELDNLREMNLEEILNSEITVTTQVPLSMREAPGIVSLVTREQILNTGSRDLVDVLNLLVPGFHFEQSQYGPISISVRGIWAYEGKVLLLVDGVECNDETFSGLLFGNHYLVENIERIEVIRGPGSVVYGGHAGLGVINIVTRGNKEFNGIYLGLQNSQMIKNYSHRNLSFGSAYTVDDFGISLTGYIGTGKLNDVGTTQYFADKSPLQNPQNPPPPQDQNSGPSSGTVTKLDPFMLNLKTNYKDLYFTAIYEKYNLNYQFPIEFEGLYCQLKYDYKISDDFRLSAKYDNKFQNPWNMKAKGLFQINGKFYDTLYSNNKRVNKNSFGISMLWDISPKIYLASGIEYQHLSFYIDSYNAGYYEIPLGNGLDEIKHSYFSAYFQLMYLSDIMNVTFGGRYDYSKDYNASFVPRVAVTKIFDPFHLKLMYSQAFRVPGGAYFGKDLNPEKSVNFEIEAGYQISKSNFLVLNVYNVMFKDIITFSSDSGKIPQYYNLDKIGTVGIEAEYRFVQKKFNLGVNLSYYHVTENTVETYKVPDNDGILLANPQIKFNIFSGIRLNRNILLSPSVSFYGARYGFVAGKFEQNNNGIKTVNTIKRFNPTAVFDLNFSYNDLIIDGLQLDLGLKNLFNAKFEYIQAFKGFSPPIQANSTAVVLRMYYEIPF